MRLRVRLPVTPASVSAMFLRRLSAERRTVDRHREFSVARSVRILDPSSRKAMSRIQRMPFSMAQWERTALAIREALALGRLVT